MPTTLSDERIGEITSVIVMALHKEGIKTADDLALVLAAWKAIGDTLPLGYRIVVPVMEATAGLSETITRLVEARRSPR